MRRVVWQLFVRFFATWQVWRLLQVLTLLTLLLAQYLLHVQMRNQLSLALARIDSLEERVRTRSEIKIRRPSDLNRHEHHARSRQKRTTEQESLNKLLERIESLENQIAASRSFNTSDRGSFCAQGSPGRNGLPGRDGKNGLPGRDGRDGTDGRDGIPGINGVPGTQGLPGRDGVTGPKGERGRKGHKGNEGPQGPSGDPIMCHKDRNTKGPREESTGANVYIRWGRNVCPADRRTTLVYEGQVAGWRPKLNQEGGANYLCMPLRPLYSKPPTGSQTKSPLYGVEYGHVEDLFARVPGQGRQISYLGVPCAVCRVERSSVLMIPARNVCPTRLWTREYHGYLMTDTTNSSKPEYICVDADASGIRVLHTKQHAGKALLTSVQGQCGVLPCPHYQQDWELTCAVCTM